MTNAKNTKRALLLSVLSMMLCVAMLAGSTFAWFTDTASTAVNRIQSGTLDVALEMKDTDGNWVSAEGKTLGWLSADGRAQDQILWEPGCTYNLTDVRVINNGNLALKYKVIINGVDGDAKLLEAIEFNYGILAEKAVGTLLPGETSDAITITGHMNELAGNEYMNLSIEGIGITVVATQHTAEKDSFDENYDANAWNEMNITDNGNGTYSSDDGKLYVKDNGAYVAVTADNTVEGLYTAESGDQYVATADALTEANTVGGNITVLDNIAIEYTTSTPKLLNLKDGQNVDFGGKTITVTSASGENGIVGTKDITATISDGTLNMNKGLGSSYPVIYANKGAVILEKMTVANTEKKGITVSAGSDGGVLEINNSTISGGAKYNDAVYCGSKANVTINDSTVIGCIRAANNGMIEVNGGDYTQADFVSDYKEHIVIYNGLFNFDPSASTEVKLASDTTYVTDNGNGTWSVATIDEGNFDDGNFFGD